MLANYIELFHLHNSSHNPGINTMEPGIKHARWQGSIQLFFFGVEAKEQVHL